VILFGESIRSAWVFFSSSSGWDKGKWAERVGSSLLTHYGGVGPPQRRVDVDSAAKGREIPSTTFAQYEIRFNHLSLRLYYEIEIRAKFVMLACGYTLSTANNANSVNTRLNDLPDTLLESQNHEEVNRTSDNYRQLTITWLTLILTIN